MSLLISETLYHGTPSQIEKIDVTKGRNNKDFGKGFYMAVTKQQAIGMMHKKFSELQNRLQNKKTYLIILNGFMKLESISNISRH